MVMIARSERGQALIEMAVVVTLLFFLVMGIVEFGRAFMVTSMITHAARDGARFGATLDPTLRSTDPASKGCFTDAGTTAIEDHVDGQLRGGGVSPSSVNVSVTQDCDASDLATVTVVIDGTIDYIFNIVGTSFAVNRTVTFADENRACPGSCS
jgi:Flp pilus assembly protein TadG